MKRLPMGSIITIADSVRMNCWSKHDECPGMRTATNDKTTKRNPEKQIFAGHAG